MIKYEFIYTHMLMYMISKLSGDLIGTYICTGGRVYIKITTVAAAVDLHGRERVYDGSPIPV